MKKRIALFLLAAVMLMLTACAAKVEVAPSTAATEPATQATEAATTEPTTQATEAPTTEAAPAAPLEYEGYYCRTWTEEIGGTVAERNSYYILNADHTGYLFMQAVGTLTWTEDQMTDNLGQTYRIALTEENGTVSLLVYEFQDTPSVYRKIDRLPDDINAAIAEASIYMRRDQTFAGVYCHSWSEEMGGTVMERKAYIVLNEGGTGYWITQEVGTVTWTDTQMTDNLGMTYSITMIEENGVDNLLVYEFPDNPSAYLRIDQLPADIAAMLPAA